jgi:molybdopterin-guanine dinucleotide biosynthesis protein
VVCAVAGTGGENQEVGREELNEMATGTATEKSLWRLIVVGGHTRSIGKTQLVCDVIRAFPRTEWIAGKITQYGHGVCARNGEDCDCAPTEHVCALDWETRGDTGTDSSRFLEAGAKRSFWLRTKQGYLAEGLPLLRQALSESSKDVDGSSNAAVIVESNSLMQFVKPSLYFAVIDPTKEDFKESAQLALDRASALVVHGGVGDGGSPAPLWMKLPDQLMREKPSVLQREGEALPEPLWVLVHRTLEGLPGAAI